MVFQFFLFEALKASQDGSLIHFTFDIQNSLEHRAIETFRDAIPAKMLKGTNTKFGDIKFSDSEKEEALQPADMHAYLWHRWVSGLPFTKDMERAFSVITRKKNRMDVIDSNSLDAMWPLLLEDAKRRIERHYNA